MATEVAASRKLIVIGGPTASGKTALAIQVAQHFGTAIISADSRQFYREMSIGNARPSPREMMAVPHHFVADRSLDEPLSAGRFAELAVERLRNMYAESSVAVAVGGSGLYLRALAEGLDEFPTVSEGARRIVQRIEDSEGVGGLQKALQQYDPIYYEQVDRSNGRRLQRALRVYFTDRKPYSSYLGQAPKRPFQVFYFAPAWERAELYERIERRVDRMLERGLEAEARSLVPYRELPVLQTVGYQEWWPYFDGEYTYERAVELIKRNSRRYAKRQITWFREYTAVKSVEELVNMIPGPLPDSDA